MTNGCACFLPRSSYTAFLLGDVGFLLHLLYACMSPCLAAACVLLYSSIEIRTGMLTLRFAPSLILEFFFPFFQASLHNASYYHKCLISDNNVLLAFSSRDGEGDRSAASESFPIRC